MREYEYIILYYLHPKKMFAFKIYMNYSKTFFSVFEHIVYDYDICWTFLLFRNRIKLKQNYFKIHNITQ